MNTPWSESLVNAAQAGVNALAQIIPDYQTLIGLRNSSESLYQESLIQAYITRENALVAARKQATEQTAAVENTKLRSIADAEAVFLESASSGSKEYLDELIDDEATDPIVYYKAHSAAYATRMLSLAKAEYVANNGKLSSDMSLLTVKTAQEQSYRHAEANAYLDSISRWSSYDEAFSISVAAATANSAVNMALSHPSPWLEHNAAQTAAYYNATVTNEGKKREAAIDKAEAQRDSEKNIATAEASNQYIKLATSFSGSIAEMTTTLNHAKSQAKAISVLGGKQYEVDLPKLSELEKPDYVVDRTIPEAVLKEYWRFDIANGWLSSSQQFIEENGHVSESASGWISLHVNKAFSHGYLTDQYGQFGFDIEDPTIPCWDNNMSIDPVVDPERLQAYVNLFPSWTQKVLDSDKFKEFPFTEMERLFLLERFYDEPYHHYGELITPNHHERYWLFHKLDIQDVEQSEQYYWNFQVGAAEYGIDIDDQPNTSLPAAKPSVPANPNATTNISQLTSQAASLRAFAAVANQARNNSNTQTPPNPAGNNPPADPLDTAEDETIEIGVTDGRAFDPEEVRKLLVAMNPDIDDIAMAKASFGISARPARPLPFPFDRNESPSQSLSKEPLSIEDLFGVNPRYRTRDVASAHEGVNVQVAPGDSDLKVASQIYRTIVSTADAIGTSEGKQVVATTPNEVIGVSGSPTSTKIESSYKYLQDKEVDGEATQLPWWIAESNYEAVRRKFPVFDRTGNLVFVLTIVSVYIPNREIWHGTYASDGILISEYHEYLTEPRSGSIRAATPLERYETQKWGKLFDLASKAERGEIKRFMAEWDELEGLATAYVREQRLLAASQSMSGFELYYTQLILNTTDTGMADPHARQLLESGLSLAGFRGGSGRPSIPRSPRIQNRPNYAIVRPADNYRPINGLQGSQKATLPTTSWVMPSRAAMLAAQANANGTVQKGNVQIAKNLRERDLPDAKEVAIAEFLANQHGIDVLLRGSNIPGGDATLRLPGATSTLRAEFKTLDKDGTNAKKAIERNLNDASDQMPGFPGAVVIDARPVSVSRADAIIFIDRAIKNVSPRRPNLREVFVITNDGTIHISLK